jgi:3',5'-cyclic AMP phosphodiesterase CpdA
MTPRLLALSDLHVGFPDNRALVENLRPQHPGDWLLLAGDVGEVFADIEQTLTTLSARFETVVWVPGNHDLWTHGKDPVRLRGEERYKALVDMCRSLGVATPEDPYRVWEGPGGPATIVPVFVLYDYTFLPDGARNKEEALAIAYKSGVVCSDEVLLHPDPYPSREAWCQARIEATQRQLETRDPALPVVFVSHYPLIREPTRVLRYPQFAQWCGTIRTRDWHVRYNATTVVYGHLHIPRVTWHNGVRFVEASVGYPREWRRRATPPGLPRQIFPEPSEAVDPAVKSASRPG